MVKFSDLLVDKSLHELSTDWAQTGVTSFGRQFDFHDVICHISLVTLTIDGETSFLQLMDAQNVHKNMCFSPNKSYGDVSNKFALAVICC